MKKIKLLVPLLLFLLLPFFAETQIIPLQSLPVTKGNFCMAHPGGQINNLNGKKYKESFTDARTKKMQKNRQHILALLRKQEEAKQAKMKAAERATSVLAERLIALSGYDYYAPDSFTYALGKVDTVILKYSNGRGSEFNYNGMGYEIPGNSYGGGYLTSYLLDGYRIKSSEPNYVPGVLCDSIRQWSTSIPDSVGIPVFIYGYTDSSYVIYDANNNIVYYNDQIDPDMMGIDDMYYNTYDISNNNITSLNVQYDPTMMVYDTFDLTIQIFSGGKLVEDSVATYSGGMFYPSEKYVYTYDGAGNLTHASYYAGPGVWTENQRYVITYNTDNTIKTDSVTVFESGSWLPEVADSFGYTSGVNFYTYMRTNDYGGSFLIDQSVITSKHLGSLGLPDTVFSYQYINPSGGTPLYLHSQSKAVYTYDAYKNPKIVYTYHLNITDSATGAGYYSAMPDGYLYYYYETYMSTAAVQNVAATPENIKIYPNPSTTSLTISSTGRITTIAIINLLGETVYTRESTTLEPLLKTGGEVLRIDVAELSKGMYLVRINGAEVRKFVKE